MATLWHRSASVQFVTSLNRSDCYRLERQLPGGFRTRWEKAPSHGAREMGASPSSKWSMCVPKSSIGPMMTMTKRNGSPLSR